MFRTIKSRLSMKKVEYAFTDIVSGKAVYYYKDCFGDLWLADAGIFGFRIKSAKSCKDE